MDRIDYHDRGDGLPLAFRHRPGAGPTILFLPGYASDMEGSKASAIDAWAAATGRAMLRFDYSGCGSSGGDFEARTLHDWKGDALAMVDRTEGPLVLVGSSMGGWLMLLAALERADRVAALVGIASAPDFTSWGFTEEQKLTLLRDGRLVERTADGEMVTTRAFWESGEALRLLHGDVAIDCPVRLLHGQADADVPWTWSIELARRLHSAQVQTLLVKDGDHRLSRDPDLRLLTATLASLVETL